MDDQLTLEQQEEIKIETEKKKELSKSDAELKDREVLKEEHGGFLRIEENMDASEEDSLPGAQQEKKKQSTKTSVLSEMKSNPAVSGPSVAFQKKLASGQTGDVAKEQAEKTKQEIGKVFDRLAKHENGLDFSKLADGLKDLDESGSDSYEEVKASLLDFEEKLSKYRADDNASFSDAMEAMLRLAEATRGYMETHKGRRKTIGGSSKKKAVRHINDAIVSPMMKVVCDQVNLPEEAEPPVEMELTPEIEKSVNLRVEELKSNYYSFAAKVGGGFFETPENKIYRRLQLFGIYKDDIRVYRAMHKDDMSDDMKKIFAEYDSLARQYRLIKWTRKNVKEDFQRDDVTGVIRAEAYYRAEKKERRVDYEDAKKYDDGLTKEQLIGIDNIDRWFLRNWNNGGLAGKGLGMLKIGCHDIISELFKRSKRERLHIYYLIETRGRKNANILQVGESQGAYTPNIDAFMNQMLATKVNFIKHMTGSYVYMHKLTEAMGISDQYHDVIINAAKLDHKEKKREADGQKKEKEDVKDVPIQVQRREEKLADFNRSLTEYRNALKACKDAGQETEGPLVDEAKRASLLAEDKLKALVAADNEVAKYCKEQGLLKDSLQAEKNVVNLEYDEVPDVVKYEGFAAKGASAVAGKLHTVLSPTVIPWNLGAEKLQGIKLWGGTASTSFAASGAMLTVMLNIYNLSKYGGDMDDGDRATTVMNIVQSLGKVASTVWSGVENATGYVKHVVELATGTGKTVAATSSVFGAAVGGLSALIGLTKMGVNAHRDGKTGSAYDAIMQKRKAQINALEKNGGSGNVKEAERIRREARYEDSMLGLSDKMHDRGLVSGGFLVGAGVVAIGGIALAAAISAGGLLVMAAGVAIGVIGGIVDAVMTGRTQKTAFDKFINLPEIEVRALEEIRKKKPGFEVKDKKGFTDQLRRKVCASLGFADVKSACDQISKNTSGYIYERIFSDKLSEQEKEPYINLVESLGLRYRQGEKPDGSDRKPTLKALQKKLSGR